MQHSQAHVSKKLAIQYTPESHRSKAFSLQAFLELYKHVLIEEEYNIPEYPSLVRSVFGVILSTL